MLLIFLFSTYTFTYASEDLNLSGQAAILIDYESGAILYEKNMDERLYPASTTKILTAILAIEYGKMDEMVTVDPEVISLTKGSHIALDYYEEVSFEDLLNALLIQSANDASLALAKHIAGSIEGFVEMMNEKAKELGAKNTNFVNPNGLHNDNHYTTAYDMALIAKYAMANETLREIASKSSYTIGPTNKKDESRYLYSTNSFFYGNDKINLNGQLIPVKYDGVICGKTGYTPEAKNCLVTLAERNGQSLIAVVLKSNGKEVYADTHKLLNYGFENFDNITLGHANEFIDNVEVENGILPYAAVVIDKTINYPLRPNSVEKVERKVMIEEDIKAPITKGDVVGTVEYYLDDHLIGKGNLISTIDILEVPPPKLYEFLLDKWYLVAFTLIISLRIIRLYNRTKRRRRRRSKIFGY
ncbi:MAG: D-alanyl-D-alanine carboxypeptidase [Tissierellia bacterium]|nr:D-alanyl-D-alanine carboxypeptidase [Tissierellia bacterium]